MSGIRLEAAVEPLDASTDSRAGRDLAAVCTRAEFLIAQGPVPYDIVYVRQPRYGDLTNTIWPEVFHPARGEPGADLMLLHPDGSEEVLVACSLTAGGNGVCSVTDPFLSFDAQWVYYSLFYDLTDTNYQRAHLPRQGADILRIRLSDRVVEQLTHGEFTPNTGAGNWDESNPLNPSSDFNRLGYGILNLGASPLPGGKIVFTSNRNAYTPPQSFTAPTLQLFFMDENGANVTPIAPITIGSALHPVTLRPTHLSRMMGHRKHRKRRSNQDRPSGESVWDIVRVCHPLLRRSLAPCALLPLDRQRPHWVRASST